MCHYDAVVFLVVSLGCVLLLCSCFPGSVIMMCVIFMQLFSGRVIIMSFILMQFVLFNYVD